MRNIRFLPRRPLRTQDIQTLDEGRFRIVPYGGIPEDDDVSVYAVKLAVGNRAFALGFEERGERWRQLASADATNLAMADSQLDAVLDQWVQREYGEEFDVLLPF